MAAMPETVLLEALASMSKPMPQWLNDAHEAAAGDGRRWIEFCVEGWVQELNHRE
jgi:hypothetical protein